MQAFGAVGVAEGRTEEFVSEPPSFTDEYASGDAAHEDKASAIHVDSSKCVEKVARVVSVNFDLVGRQS